MIEVLVVLVCISVDDCDSANADWFDVYWEK